MPDSQESGLTVGQAVGALAILGVQGAFFATPEPVVAVVVEPYSELPRGAETVRQLESLGIDVSGVTDLDLFMDLADGRNTYLQSIARRLTTPRGTLRRHPDYGYDLRDWLGEALGPAELAEIRGEVEREALKDERTDAAEAMVAFDPQSEHLYLDLSLATAEGPYRLVMHVSDLDVKAFIAGEG